MKLVKELLDANTFELLVIAAVFLVIGRKMIGGKDALSAWAKGIAGLAFIGLLGTGFVLGRRGDELVNLVLTSACASCVVLGTTWIVFSLASLFYAHLLRPVVVQLGAWSHVIGEKSRERRQEQLRIKEQVRQRQAYEREAPSRERDRLRVEEESRLNLEAKRVRENARAHCEIFFHLHAPEIGQRFPRASFDEFLKTHLSDDRPAAYVQERAQQLLDLLQHHVNKTDPTSRKDSLAELAIWFAEEKGKILAAPLPDTDKESLVSDLEEQYLRLQQSYIRRMHP